MHWIAPSEKDTDNQTLEKRLWDAGMKCEGRSSSGEVQSVRHSEFVIRHLRRLPAEARFDYLLHRPEAENIGVAKCEVRVANSEVQSVRHSKFVIRHSHRLWIQLFHSALNAKGRAGFVMDNSASEAHFR